MNIKRVLLTTASVSIAAIVGYAIATAPNATAASSTTPTVDQAVQQAAAYAVDHGLYAGIAVLDTQTGKMYSAGNSTTRVPSASVVKAEMATYLCKTGKWNCRRTDVHTYLEQKAWVMITQSDNKAFEFFLGRYFDGLARNLYLWMKQYYPYWRIGGPPAVSWCWGSTQITARGITRLYEKVLQDPDVAPWLTNAMHHYQAVVDGFNQTFGLPHATDVDGVRHAGVKQGWSSKYSGGCSAEYPYMTVLNSTGIVGGRYAVAILTQSKYTIAVQRQYISHMAAIIAPAGVITAPAP